MVLIFEFIRNTDLESILLGANRGAEPFLRKIQPAVAPQSVRRNRRRTLLSSDHAFFFFSYAGLRQTSGQLLTGAIVPDYALERIGDFTQSPVIPNNPATQQGVDRHQYFLQLRQSRRPGAFLLGVARSYRGQPDRPSWSRCRTRT